MTLFICSKGAVNSRGNATVERTLASQVKTFTWSLCMTRMKRSGRYSVLQMDAYKAAARFHQTRLTVIMCPVAESCTSKAKADKIYPKAPNDKCGIDLALYSGSLSCTSIVSDVARLVSSKSSESRISLACSRREQ